MQKFEEFDEDLETIELERSKNIEDFLSLGFYVSCISSVMSIIVCLF